MNRQRAMTSALHGLSSVRAFRTADFAEKAAMRGQDRPWDDSQSRIIRHEHALSLRSLFTVLAIATSVWLLVRIWQILLLLIIALVLAGTLSPLIGWLERHHVARTLGLGLVLLALVVAVAGTGALLIPALVTQVRGLVVSAPTFQGRLADYLVGVPAFAGHASPEEGLHIPVIVLTVLCSGKESCLLFDPIMAPTCLVRR